MTIGSQTEIVILTVLRIITNQYAINCSGGGINPLNCKSPVLKSEFNETSDGMNQFYVFSLMPSVANVLSYYLPIQKHSGTRLSDLRF